MTDLAGSTSSVAVCVITYMRPQGLARLLESLAALTFRKNPAVQVRVVVVDNDAAGSARPIVEQAAARLPWPVEYAVEPRRGISFARNRAVALAQGCGLVAFIDDDELADAAWLDELLAAQQAYDADVVAGPVQPIFEQEPPAWVLQGRFVGVRRFERARRPTGSAIPYASTASVLLRRRALDSVDGPFHPGFALSGGSDLFLTRQLAQAGARLIWCDEAIVSEVVPASRARAGWIIQRAYRVGNTLSLCEKELEPTARQAVLRALRGGACIADGLAGLLPSAFRGRARVVGMLAYAARGAGILAGSLGRRFEEYRSVHGA
jgi:GT2 family glycosyltransferase